MGKERCGRRDERREIESDGEIEEGRNLRKKESQKVREGRSGNCWIVGREGKWMNAGWRLEEEGPGL